MCGSWRVTVWVPLIKVCVAAFSKWWKQALILRGKMTTNNELFAPSLLWQMLTVASSVPSGVAYPNLVCLESRQMRWKNPCLSLLFISNPKKKVRQRASNSSGQGHLWILQRWRDASRIFASLLPKQRCITVWHHRLWCFIPGKMERHFQIL